MDARLTTRTAAPAYREDRKAQFLAFTLGEETFGIPVAAIQEVIQYDRMGTLPLMPGFVRGVINLRGAVVPVLDLAVLFGRSAMEAARRTCIVILDLERDGRRSTLGVMVDTVQAVLDLASADLEPPPSFGSSIRPEFLAGIAKVDGKFVILLDMAHALSAGEWDACQEA